MVESLALEQREAYRKRAMLRRWVVSSEPRGWDRRVTVKLFAQSQSLFVTRPQGRIIFGARRLKPSIS